jgi:hypothetical protein
MPRSSEPKVGAGSGCRIDNCDDELPINHGVERVDHRCVTMITISRLRMSADANAALADQDPPTMPGALHGLSRPVCRVILVIDQHQGEATVVAKRETSSQGSRTAR